MRTRGGTREKAGDPWHIIETDRATGSAIEELGSSLLMGNGYMGYRGTLEEDTRERMPATIVAGLYDGVGDLWREPVNLPNALSLQVIADGTPLDARTCPLESHSQSLDLYRAVHKRKTTFAVSNDNAITVTCTRFASATELHLLCLRCVVEARQDCMVTLRIGIDGDVWDLNGPHLEELQTAVDRDVVSVSARTHERGVPVAASQCISVAGVSVHSTRAGRCAITDVTVSMAAGAPYTVDVIASLYTGLDCADPLSQSRRAIRDAAARGFGRLLHAHCDEWRSRWERCDIVIDGDPEAQRAMRFNMYHLLAIAPTHASNLSIPARGLSGQMYKGAIFWDTEIFMLPFFTHTFPEIARNLLMYRYHTIDGARRKAREYGFRGAFYAWESQDSGDDACTLFNVTDVFTHRPIRTYFRDKQVHISADIVYALWGYFAATGDDSILLDGGAEVIFECCRFLLSYLYYSREKNRYEILDVTGPDEYHERVHNNAYTNWMTAHAFEVCVNVSAYLESHHPIEARSLMEKLGFLPDREAIREVSGLLYRPAADPRTSVIAQFDGYGALEDVPVEEVLRRKLHVNEYLGGGNGLAVPTQVIKQADVILGLSLLGSDRPREVKTANWEYYEPRTEHGSSLSACAYALVAADIGKIGPAYGYFMKAATTDLGGTHKGFIGTLYIGGTHPAASGGAWMAAVFGLCGIGFSERTITIQPRLPDPWSQARVPVVYHGRKLVITLSRRNVVVDAGPGAELQVKVGGRAYPLVETARLVIPL